ncbi:MAG TPA: tRNA epoxyqueuosine(34) reductase QueG [Pirellulales bacterium]|nr:tRNA epoxyqueuosine(34) reductase QueG [Pirellulales bacterium]
MDAAELTAALKREARRLGFDLAGACPAVTPPGVERFEAWLAAGYAGEMAYLGHRADAYRHPRSVLDGARSLLLLAMNYRTRQPAEARAGQGRISRYAWGDDYHDVIHDRLKRLVAFFEAQAPGGRARGIVDTAPLLEREFAQLAGLGWVGKNTLLLNQRLGSWFFLAALVTDAELAYDAPHAADHCGSCRACLDACPTGAFAAPYVLDSRRCISYLTIELRGAIPTELRAGLGDWVFGCDVCQDVCPWNHKPPVTDEPAFQPSGDGNPLDLARLFELDDAQFRARFRHTPLWRAKRRGLLRNAAVVLGNQRHPDGLHALTRGLHDDEPLVRAACAWALGQYGDGPARAALLARAPRETEDDVREEIAAALKEGKKMEGQKMGS